MTLLRRLSPWLAGAAMIALAWAAVALAPTDAETEAPFRTTMPIGEHVEARTLAGTLVDVRLADRLESGEWEAEGTWLVLDLALETVDEPAALRWAQLQRPDGRGHRATERIESLLDEALSAGIPLRGVLVFELPADARTETVRVDLGPMLADTRADALLSVEVDLSALEPRARIDLAAEARDR